MKNSIKRLSAFLLVLVLCISLMPVQIPAADAATVNYVYDGEYIYNWGKRGTTATFLSPKAEAFYTARGVTYDELVALSGGTQSTAPSSALYAKLKKLMTDAHSYKTSYNATRDLYQYTDCENSGRPTTISSFYSGIAIGPEWDGGGTWNREHTWPDSKGLGGSDENDIMMLRPTSKSENSSRHNTAYGKSSGYYDPNVESGNKLNLHGDVARIMLYTYVRWGNTGKMWGTAGVMESKDVLLEWMEEDPVDTWELGRNDSVQAITGTRNVFVDYPELAFQMFNEEIPTDMATPSGMAAAGVFEIKATVNDPAMGRVEINGQNIAAYPADGCYIQGYTVVDGQATVTRNDNVFVVDTTAACTVQIIFAARPVAEIGFYENEVELSTTRYYVDDVITLPEHSGTLPQDYSFLGWVEGPVVQAAQKPEAIYLPGQELAVNASANYYALYSWVDETAGTGNLYTLYSGQLVEGDYIIYFADVKAGALKAAQKDIRLDYEPFTVSEDMIQGPIGEIVWHIAPAGDYWTLYNAKNNVYAAGNGKSSQATLSASVTDFAKWSVTGDTIYEFKNLGNTIEGQDAFLRKNFNYGFACYKEAFKDDLTLYRGVPGTVYYSTNQDPTLVPNPPVTPDPPAIPEPPALAAPEKPYKIVNTVSGVHVYWNALGDIQKYGLWRSETGKDGTYKWIANPTATHFTDTKVESGKTYWYQVTAMYEEGKHSDKSPAIGIAYVATPDISLRVNRAAGIGLGWDKIDGATGYAIYRKSYSGNDAWVRIATVQGGDTLSWDDTSVRNNNGNIYRYTIRALHGTTLSGCRNTGRTMVRLTSRTLSSVSSLAKGSAKVTWGTTSQATGYEIRFMVGSTVYKTFTVGSYKIGTKTFTNLPAGTYKIQVRAYKQVDGVGSFYSAWSTAKTLTVQ